ncbi:O-methyltransferase [Moraxella sp. ZY210820]|uniref:O-methyltransferase n=1 Tax=unclassified Moraxella TaxID=2685852 RepID=UPI002731025D|nr:O-methyltransferase [Moraxella sp. ZY210820]WLF84773.1 O-methyltransferase [Moraxella sp. ZY210820]
MSDTPSLWAEIDKYIDEHLIPPQPQLDKTLENTALHGFSNHLAVAPNQGMFLKMLVQMNHCKRVLELGTFAAYSTQWLAQALPDDGYLLTIEGRETHVAMARENLALANISSTIDLRHGRGVDILQQLIEQNIEPFDFIFIDADKQSYPQYLALSLQLSRSGTVIVLDNVIRAGDILDKNNYKPSIEGIRQMYKTMYNHPQILSCTALQTVGSKGHDGFAIAIVK